MKTIVREHDAEGVDDEYNRMVDGLAQVISNSLSKAIAEGFPIDAASDALLSSWVTLCVNHGFSREIGAIAQAVVDEARAGKFDLPEGVVQ